MADQQVRFSQGPYPPFTSVIIPVYCDAARLRLCVEALEAQSYPASSFEIVIVINGDDRRHYEWAEGRPNTKIFEEPKPGSYAARNCGLRSSVGEVLAFTDSDCIPDRLWLEKGVGCLLENEEVGLVGGGITLTSRNARKNAVESYDALFHLNQRFYVERRHFSCTANLFTRRDVFQRIGTFNESRFSGGDREWGTRAHAAGVPLVYEEGAIILHPARASLRALLRKERRSVGGQMRAYQFENWFKFSKLEIGRVLGSLTLTRGEPMLLRCRILAVSVVAMFVRSAEALKLSLGGAAVR